MHIRKITGFVFVLIFSLQFAVADIRFTQSDGKISFENELFKREFMLDSKGNIFPSAFIIKSDSKNLFAEDMNLWFEFSVNNSLVSNLNGGWKIENIIERPLENGGKEFSLSLKGRYALRIVYKLQLFPKSLFSREVLELYSSDNTRLTKYKDSVHIIFPKYQVLPGKSKSIDIEEIQLAKWEGEVLDDMDMTVRPNDRLNFSGGKSGRNLSQNHMYHPGVFHFENEQKDMRGPIAAFINKKTKQGWIIAYEHGSPDDDTEQNYINIDIIKTSKKSVALAVEAVKGAYFDGEIIPFEKPYSTYWVEFAPFSGDSFDDAQRAFWNFMYYNQSEQCASRKPTLYYNTWGMQRDAQMEKKGKPQAYLTEKRVLEEIDYAHRMGVDVFVIDDGWQNHFGDWQLVSDRFPNGLKVIKAKLDSYNMKLGLWFAAEGIAPESNVFKNHPEYLVRDNKGEAVIGRWNRPIGCFSSDYKDYFITLLKGYMDEGVTYFKWDGLDKHFCSSPDHYHGDKRVSPEERAIRSGYDFILQVTDAAKQLTEYNPELVIVFDMTEEMRNLGLAFLSEARYFWINNGATWYDDLSFYRAKSIRSVTYEYNQILPTLLQTSANYPHQSAWYGAQRYNVNTSFLGGGGFWGDLSEVDSIQQGVVGDEVREYKKVRHVVVSTRPKVTGKIGSSPEIYEFINTDNSEGAVIAFSGEARRDIYKSAVLKRENFFTVVRNAYTFTKDNRVKMTLLFPQADATNEAFILNNKDFTGRIQSSTCWLKSANIESEKEINFVNGALGKQEVIWPVSAGFPTVMSSNDEKIEFKITKNGAFYKVLIEEKEADIQISIKGK